MSDAVQTSLPSHPSSGEQALSSAHWLALIAALLGWMFDGFEMGLLPLVANGVFTDLLKNNHIEPTKEAVGFYFAMANAAFLVGAAAGGVVFGWMGDRIGRVRAMAFSILTYSVFSGLSGFALTPWHVIGTRFLSALGMGGEWSLGVALVMEVWQGRSRALLAGLIGAAANAGYLLVPIISLSFEALKSQLKDLGLHEEWVSWRLLLVCGALPAVLTLLIRFFVPESENWEREQQRGNTSAWNSVDLLAVLLGVVLCIGLLGIWQSQLGEGSTLSTQGAIIGLSATLVVVVLVGACYLYPIIGYLRRANEPDEAQRFILGRMLLAALLSGVPLLATWGAVQWAPAWADQLATAAKKEDPTREAEVKTWKSYTQLGSAFGAIVGCVIGAAYAGWAGRRIAYMLLCLLSLGSVLLFYQTNTTYNLWFLTSATLMGATSAAFYGWLPLYLPELFPTRVRATGQGFGFNFGRILAAVGVLLVPVLIGVGQNADYANACSYLSAIYVVGVVVIWLAPETHGQPLPE
jgi:MFS family permease